MLYIISNKFVLVNKLESDYLNDKNGKKIIKHSFLSDMFVNTLLFQIEILINDVVNLKVDLESNHPLVIEQLKNVRKSNQCIMFRLKNFFLGEKMNLNQIIKINVFHKTDDEQYVVLNKHIKLPEHIRYIYSEMNSDDINRYLEDKKKSDNFNDNFSISSYDVESESFEVEPNSNDDL